MKLGGARAQVACAPRALQLSSALLCLVVRSALLRYFHRVRRSGTAAACEQVTSTMTTTRRYTCDDLFHFSSTNLDALTETVCSWRDVRRWVAHLQAPGSRLRMSARDADRCSITWGFIASTWLSFHRCARSKKRPMEQS